MNVSTKEQLASAVETAYVAFMEVLGQRAFPQAAFRKLFETVVQYFEATRHDQMLHRCVVSHINGIRELIAVSRKRVPGSVLHDADRMECMIFGGHDPEMEVQDLMDED
jgi:hypothetical protein